MATERKQAKAARSQVLFREINEAIRAVTIDSVPDGETAGFMCECADLECTQTIELTLAEYEAVRAAPTRFPTAPGHEWRDVERVVERHARYQVVEKVGVAAAVAAELASHERVRPDGAGPAR